MGDSDLISVREAAERLGLTPVAVRRQISAGSLPATKRGRDWWIDRRRVERRARQEIPKGRPLSPPLAWSVLLAASGEEQAAAELAGRYRSRMRAWLAEHPLAECAPQLRARAEVEEFDAHPAELPRILARRDILATGASAAKQIGLVVVPGKVVQPCGRGLVAEGAVSSAEVVVG